MATSVSPRSAQLHPTRQQLDELDALLQRMLDLPVNKLEEEEPAEEAETPAPEFRAPVSYSVPIAEPPPRLEPRVVPVAETPVSPPPAPAEMPPPEAREPGPDDWVRLASTWQPSPRTWQPLAQSWQHASRPAARPAVPPEPPAAPPTSAPAVVVQAPPPAAAEPVAPPEPEFSEEFLVPAAVKPLVPAQAPGYSLWEWPFVAVNAIFDVATLPLGPFGAGLRSNIGRNLLAAAGFLCLAAAVVVATGDWIGWIW